MQVTKHTSKGSTLGMMMISRGDVTRSLKQGYQWPHKKDSCPPKFFFKKLAMTHGLTLPNIYFLTDKKKYA